MSETTNPPKEASAKTFLPPPLLPGGPTLEQYVAAGYAAENYPPAGYAPVPSIAEPPPYKIYHAKRANQSVAAGKFVFNFTPYEQAGGMWLGFYLTENVDEIAALDELVATKKSVVDHLTIEDYERCLKKKVRGSTGMGQSLLSSQPVRTVDPSAGGLLAQAVNPEPAKAPLAIAKPAETVNEALATGKV